MFKKLLALLLIPSLAFGQAASSVIAEKPIIQGATGVQVVVTGTGEIRLVTSADTTAKGFYIDSSTGALTSVGGAPISLGGDLTLTSTLAQINKIDNTGYIALAGGATYGTAAGGNIEIAGISHANTGSVSIYPANNAGAHILNILTNASSEWRVRSGANTMWTFDSSGYLVQNGTSGSLLIFNRANTTMRFNGAMGNSTKAPQTVAPDDWIEVNIAGTVYYIPVYAAS